METDDLDITPYMLAEGGALDVEHCPDCWEKHAHIERYEFAIHVLSGIGAAWLDFGCGAAFGTLLLSKAHPAVLGVDCSFEARELAKQYYPHLSIAPRVPADGVFGAVIAFEVFEHMDRPNKFVDSIQARHIVASVPIVPTVGINPHHKHDFTIASFRRLIQRRFDIRWEFGQRRQFQEQPVVWVIHGEARASAEK